MITTPNAESGEVWCSVPGHPNNYVHECVEHKTIEALSRVLYHLFGNIGEAATPRVSGSHVEMARVMLASLRGLPVEQRMVLMDMQFDYSGSPGWVEA